MRVIRARRALHPGHTYDNECNLNSNACWNDLNTTVVRMGPCEMPLIEFIVAEQEYEEEDGVGEEEEEEDYYGGESDLADVATEEGCTAACQDILGRGLDGVMLCFFTPFLGVNFDFSFFLTITVIFVASRHSSGKGVYILLKGFVKDL